MTSIDGAVPRSEYLWIISALVLSNCVLFWMGVNHVSALRDCQAQLSDAIAPLVRAPAGPDKVRP